MRAVASKFKRDDGYYDCVIAVSGGKDSYYQTYVFKVILGMNPLLVSVQDPFTKTEAGKHNLRNLCEVFGCDLLTFTLDPDSTRKMVRAAFEGFGSPTWPIDRAIYTVPLQVALRFEIPLVVYGEDVSYLYGGPLQEETPSARNQILNDVVKPIPWEYFFERGVSQRDVCMLQYPSTEELQRIEPIYLSYFVPWDGHANYLLAKRYGFRDLTHEWKREGYIEDYDQIDSIGYLVHPWLKYPKFGFARATDVACYWIRSGRITRAEAVALVREHDHRLDQRALDDFLKFTGYSSREFWEIVDRFWNRDIFVKMNGEWKLKEPVH